MAKQPRIYAVLGPFVFAYPHITSPDTEGKFADNKYKVDGVGDPKGAAMVEAQELVTRALKEFGLPKKGTNIPIKRETTKEGDKKVETGKLLIKTKSQYAPAIVDAQGEPIPAKALKKMTIGAGSEGRLEGYFQAYTTTDKVKDKETGEIETVETKGVNFTLTGVQLLKLVKGGTGGSSFGAYGDGGFTYAAGDDDDDDGDTGLDIGSDADDDGDDEGGLDI